MRRVDGSLTLHLGKRENMTVWKPEDSDVECYVRDHAGNPVEDISFSASKLEARQGSFVKVTDIIGAGKFTIKCRNGVGAVTPALGQAGFFGGIITGGIGTSMALGAAVMRFSGSAVRLKSQGQLPGGRI